MGRAEGCWRYEHTAASLRLKVRAIEVRRLTFGKAHLCEQI